MFLCCMRVLGVIQSEHKQPAGHIILLFQVVFHLESHHYLYIQDLDAIKPENCMKNFLTILWVLITNVLTFAETSLLPIINIITIS